MLILVLWYSPEQPFKRPMDHLAFFIDGLLEATAPYISLPCNPTGPLTQCSSIHKIVLQLHLSSLKLRVEV